MRLDVRTLLLGLVVAAAQTGCESPSPPRRAEAKPALSANARPPATAGLSAGEVERAAKLYTTKCARCHKLYDPAGYRDAEWRSWMTRMSKKARLTPDQTQFLSRYLEAFRTQKEGEPPPDSGPVSRAAPTGLGRR